MKTVKTSDLTGLALDWAVAKCLGVTVRVNHGYEPAICLCSTQDAARFGGTWVFIPSRDWRQSGPIIERERICIDIGHEGVWLAYSKQNYADDKEFLHAGSTPLIAAARSYVASKLGDTIEIPEELLS